MNLLGELLIALFIPRPGWKLVPPLSEIEAASPLEPLPYPPGVPLPQIIQGEHSIPLFDVQYFGKLEGLNEIARRKLRYPQEVDVCRKKGQWISHAYRYMLENC